MIARVVRRDRARHAVGRESARAARRARASRLAQLVARAEELPDVVERAGQVERPALEHRLAPAGEQRAPAGLARCADRRAAAAAAAARRTRGTHRRRRRWARRRAARGTSPPGASTRASSATTLEVVEQHEREVAERPRRTRRRRNGSACALPCTPSRCRGRAPRATSRRPIAPRHRRGRRTRDRGRAPHATARPGLDTRPQPLVAPAARERGGRGRPGRAAWNRAQEDRLSAPPRYTSRALLAGILMVTCAAASWGTWSLFLRPTGLPATVDDADHVRGDGARRAAARAARPRADLGPHGDRACCSRTPRSTRSTSSRSSPRCAYTTVAIAVLTHYLAPILIALLRRAHRRHAHARAPARRRSSRSPAS